MNETQNEIKGAKESKTQCPDEKTGILYNKETPASTSKDNSNNSVNSLLANGIWLFHLLVIAFVLIAPFTQLPALFILHITFSFSLLVHWYCNSNVCSLSMIESKLRGLDYTESFTHRLVAPIYDISKTTWSKLCYTVTIILMCIAIYKLITSVKWKQAWEAYNQQYKIFNSGTDTTNWYTRMLVYLRCFEPLFMLC